MERLTAIAGRVVASLVEKELLTPQAYPLTLHALTAACNQSTSRDPVMTLTDGDVAQALEELKAVRLVRFVLPSHGRSVVRYRHVLGETLGIDTPQLAVLAALELRGPQTVAELRQRTERMAPIESVEHDLALLAHATSPLVERLSRGPGQKEERWRSLLAVGPDGTVPAGTAQQGEAQQGEVEQGDRHRDRSVARPIEAAPPDTARPGTGAAARGAASELDALAATVEELRRELAVLRTELADLRESLGG